MEPQQRQGKAGWARGCALVGAGSTGRFRSRCRRAAHQASLTHLRRGTHPRAVAAAPCRRSQHPPGFAAPTGLSPGPQGPHCQCAGSGQKALAGPESWRQGGREGVHRQHRSLWRAGTGLAQAHLEAGDRAGRDQLQGGSWGCAHCNRARRRQEPLRQLQGLVRMFACCDPLSLVTAHGTEVSSDHNGRACRRRREGVSLAPRQRGCSRADTSPNSHSEVHVPVIEPFTTKVSVEASADVCFSCRDRAAAPHRAVSAMDSTSSLRQSMVACSEQRGGLADQTQGQAQKRRLEE